MTRSDLRAALDNANVAAFLRAIRTGETNPDDDEAYRALFGWSPGNGKTFDSFADHPRQAFRSAWGWTSAAGAYQAMCAVPGKVRTDTWGDFVRACGPSDISPASQDLFAVWCVNRRKALDDVKAGRFEAAVAKCAREWASLPGSPYGQPRVSMDALRAVYVCYGGTFAPAGDFIPLAQPAQLVVAPPVTDETGTATVEINELIEPVWTGETPAPLETDTQPPAPVEDAAAPLPPITQQEASMPLPFIAGAFLKAAIPSLVEMAPALIRMFGNGGEVNERNAKVAEMVVEKAKEVTGAQSGEEAVTIMQSDPQAAERFRQSVREEQDAWLGMVTKIAELEENSRDKARAFAGQMNQPVAGKFTFVELLSLMMFVFSAIGGVLMVIFGDLNAELKGAIVTLMLIGGYTKVAEFWLGSSYGSITKNPPPK